ncbi:MAG: hypothetical protein K9J06_07530 [Flavobacteriales bacterium]|nr:hypothetical protein [Flavobacteriales bacterium]
MFRISILLSMMLPSALLAQDVLLLTNGKYRKLKGKVVATDYDRVVYQTSDQALREAAYLDRRGMTQEQFDAEESERTASARQRLVLKRQEMEAQILTKMEELSPDDFQVWKNAQLLKLAEAEAAIGSRKARQAKRRFTKIISRERVFSIIHPDSSETIIYSADTLGFLADGNAEVEWGVEDMRKYIQGRQDGRRHPVGADALLGAGVGAVGAFLGAFWGPSIPAGYVVVTSIANIKVKVRAKDVDPDLITHPAYLDGYERSARNRKTMTFVQGAVAGLGFGFIMYQGVFR